MKQAEYKRIRAKMSFWYPSNSKIRVAQKKALHHTQRVQARALIRFLEKKETP